VNKLYEYVKIRTNNEGHCTSTLVDPNPNHNLTLNNINEWDADLRIS
jgi:hypothetical protein